MSRLDLYVLRDPAARIPMPDRGGRLFSPAGETVGVEDRFYAPLIVDRDIVPASRGAPDAPHPAAEPGPVPDPGAGRANVPDGQSPSRPSADHDASRKGKRT